MNARSHSASRIAAFLLAAALALPASAMFVRPNDAPVERLIKNLQAHVKEHPDDANAWYTLARVQNLAFSLKSDILRVWDYGGGLPRVPDMFNRQPPKNANAPDAKLMREYLVDSIKNYNKAISLDEKNGLYHLGLASVLEAAAASDIDLPPIPDFKPDKQPKDWKPAYLNSSIREYLRAYDLSIEKDSKIQRQPIEGLSALVSYEAGTHYLALAGREGVEPDLKTRTAAVQAEIDKFNAKPMGGITPIVFSLSPVSRLDDLLDPGRTVRFDLDGTGRGQAWPWVKPATGILVWDPAGSGRIESGRQLFGTVTWWMFWPDGYAALSALDDNRDGRLAGDELRGLAVWFDRNSDGVSNPGEVVPLQSLGVQEIQTHWTARDGKSYSNRLGMKLNDGRTIATWDWVVDAK